jgi:hypothetical protein
MPGLYGGSAIPHYFLESNASVPQVQYIHADGTIENVEQPHIAEEWNALTINQQQPEDVIQDVDWDKIDDTASVASSATRQKKHVFLHFFSHELLPVDETTVVPVPQFYFPFMSPAYHLQVRLAGGVREGLLVDCGAIGNLAGSNWIARVQAIGEKYGQGTAWSNLENAISVQGVGNGSNEAQQEAQVPIALGTNQIGTFRTPVLPESDLPALWGLVSLEKLKAIIDVGSRRLVIPGPGGFKMVMSPGSKSYPLEKSPTGHLLLSCCEWEKAKGSGTLQL